MESNVDIDGWLAKERMDELSDEERLILAYIPVTKAITLLYQRNPKKHDMEKLTSAIVKYGMRDPSGYDEALGAIAHGNGRIEAVFQLYQSKLEGMDVIKPKYIPIVTDTGEWCVPVTFGANSESLKVAQKYVIDHNNLTMSGGSYNAKQMSNMWEYSEYVALLSEAGPTETVSEKELEYLLSLTEETEQDDLDDEHEFEEQAVEDEVFKVTLSMDREQHNLYGDLLEALRMEYSDELTDTEIVLAAMALSVPVSNN